MKMPTNMSNVQLLEEVERADGYIKLNPERKNKKTIAESFQVQLTTIDLVLGLSDVPNKQEFMERVRNALNVLKDPEDMTPEEQQAFMAQKQQEQEQMALIGEGYIALSSKHLILYARCGKAPGFALRIRLEREALTAQ